jgi:hypothetical protein
MRPSNEDRLIKSISELLDCISDAIRKKFDTPVRQESKPKADVLRGTNADEKLSHRP